jgi:hypothetical protein
LLTQGDHSLGQFTPGNLQKLFSHLFSLLVSCPQHMVPNRMMLAALPVGLGFVALETQDRSNIR